MFLGILVGLGLARKVYIGQEIALITAPFVILSLRSRNVLTLLLVLLIGTGIGGWRGSIYMQKLTKYEAFYNQKVIVTARAAEDAVYGKTKQLSFAARDVHVNGQPMAGKIQLSGFGVNAVFQDDEMVAEGKLFPGFGAFRAV